MVAKHTLTWILVAGLGVASLAPAQEDQVNESQAPQTPAEPDDKNVDVVDLSDIDIEEEERHWESLPGHGGQGVPITEGIRIEDIVEPPGDYHYSAFGRENPFLMPPNVFVTDKSEGVGGKKMLDAMGNAIGPEKTSMAGADIPIISPLQRHALDLLALKGIWQQGSGKWRAMIMTPKNEGIIVKPGDPISAGKILDIKKGHIIVRQYFLREDGSREYQDSEHYLGEYNKPVAMEFIKLKPGEKPDFGSESKPDEMSEENAAKEAGEPAPVDAAGRAPALNGVNQPVPAAPGPPGAPGVVPGAAPAAAGVPVVDPKGTGEPATLAPAAAEVKTEGGAEK